MNFSFLIKKLLFGSMLVVSVFTYSQERIYYPIHDKSIEKKFNNSTIFIVEGTQIAGKENFLNSTFYTIKKEKSKDKKIIKNFPKKDKKPKLTIDKQAHEKKSVKNTVEFKFAEREDSQFKSTVSWEFQAVKAPDHHQMSTDVLIRIPSKLFTLQKQIFWIYEYRNSKKTKNNALTIRPPPQYLSQINIKRNLI